MSERRHGDPAVLDLTWDDSHAGAMALLPMGPAWPRDRDGVLSRTVRGLTGNHWRAWRRLVDLLNEADPRTCLETLEQWEEDCGLPDPCIGELAPSLELRRLDIVTKRQAGATTTPQQFIDLAARLGWEISVIEFRPFRAWSECEDYINGDVAGWSHCWLVEVHDEPDRLTYFRCDSLCTEFLVEWGYNSLECLFEQLKPAHSYILWAYTGVLPPP